MHPSTSVTLQGIILSNQITRLGVIDSSASVNKSKCVRDFTRLVHCGKEMAEFSKLPYVFIAAVRNQSFKFVVFLKNTLLFDALSHGAVIFFLRRRETLLPGRFVAAILYCIISHVLVHAVKGSSYKCCLLRYLKRK